MKEMSSILCRLRKIKNAKRLEPLRYNRKGMPKNCFDLFNRYILSRTLDSKISSINFQLLIIDEFVEQTVPITTKSYFMYDK